LVPLLLGGVAGGVLLEPVPVPVLEPVPVPVPVPEPVPPLEPLLPLEPLPVPMLPVPLLPLPPVVPPELLVPVAPMPPVPDPELPLMPLEPLEPLELPLMPLEPLVPLELPLMPLSLLPLWLELLCFLPCFFLLLLSVVDELVPWSPLVPDAPVWLLPDCELCPVELPLWSLEPLVWALATSAPHIAAATEAPNRPFNNLFIFMTLS
jgi:signal-induced proliferation-associated 1 like protein 3